MATTNHERVGKALDLLKAGLAPGSSRVEQGLASPRLLASGHREGVTTVADVAGWERVRRTER